MTGSLLFIIIIFVCRIILVGVHCFADHVNGIHNSLRGQIGCTLFPRVYFLGSVVPITYFCSL
ncbi:hypothetical protein K435DRAFT_269875 [Dendrothele bispora CBS 962.96]|uniref:Uncharacterized protein n=1 Tax=Dendrothele bispora (strain CBS 962.96) TaxID=1314807 RepID=A0A4V4HHQ9_DENBC|nr:hypothetical protein K435DRAFT_269875 [Dendrothele bispora CBS 962.96]